MLRPSGTSRSAGVAWTALRNSFHTCTSLQMSGAGLETGDLHLPAENPMSWTTQEDLAVAAALALTEPDR